MFIGDKDMTIPDNHLVDSEWKKLLNNCYEYNEPVDNIGNRYYYVKKNFLLSLIKGQTSLIQRAKDEKLNYQGERTIMDPGKIYDEYNEMFNGKKFDYNELNNLLDIFSNILDKRRIDIHTVGKEYIYYNNNI